MTKKRKKYTEEFRSSAVKLVTEQGYQITEAARNLGINESANKRSRLKGMIYSYKVKLRIES